MSRLSAGAATLKTSVTLIDRLPVKKGPVLLALAILAPLMVWGVWEGIQNVIGRPIIVTGIIQAKEIPIASKVGGRIARVAVEEGQIVVPRQLLIELDLPELEARREKLVATIKESESELTKLRNGPRPAEIDQARATARSAYANWQMLARGFRPEEVREQKELMEKARDELAWAQREWLRFGKLAAEGAVPRRDAEEAKARMDVAREAYEAAMQPFRKMARGPRAEEIEAARQKYLEARAALRLLEQGTRKEDIDKAEAQLSAAKADLAEVEAQLQEKVILSPAQAEVSALDLHAGEIVAPNRSIGTLTRLDTIWTRVFLPERELSRVQVGQQVKVKVDAYPGREFTGTIVQIPGVAEFTPRNVQTPEERSAQVFALKVVIDNEERLLRGGMNAEVTLPPAGWHKPRLATR